MWLLWTWIPHSLVHCAAPDSLPVSNTPPRRWTNARRTTLMSQCTWAYTDAAGRTPTILRICLSLEMRDVFCFFFLVLQVSSYNPDLVTSNPDTPVFRPHSWKSKSLCQEHERLWCTSVPFSQRHFSLYKHPICWLDNRGSDDRDLFPVWREFQLVKSGFRGRLTAAIKGNTECT